MPRNPTGKKNQHNHRHENGLVGPGRRVTKQKSNGHINGNPRGAVTDEPVPAHGSADLPMTGPATNASTSALPESRKESGQDSRSAALKAKDSESSLEAPDKGANGDEAATTQADERPRRTDVAPPKSRSPYDINPIQFASTILRSCPGHDTVALLIFLLALPSLMLTIIQALFASLTFMPPTGITPGTFLSFFDVFQNAAGAPSFTTMAWVDVICLGLWFCLWNWAQSFALDLAQVQIAITLGGGGGGKGSEVNTVCFVFVFLLHLVRSRGVRQFCYNNVLPHELLKEPRIARLARYLPSDADFGDSPRSPSILRSLFAVHILAQALMAYVRKRVANAQTGPSSKPIKRVDPEALSGGQSTPEHGSPDSHLSTVVTSGHDHLPPPTPGLKDGKDKGTSAKKRRRQANQVRSRQPFWAALASTKVHVLREYEQSTTSYKKGSSRSDAGGDMVLGSERVWMTGIDSSTIRFEAANLDVGVPSHDGGDGPDDKPFIIRINGARWTSVSIDAVDESESVSGKVQWRGQIVGLTPNCTYTCSFVRTDTDEEFADIMVKTRPLLDKDVPSTFNAAPIRQSTRPSSPATTIRNSIQSAEAKLNDARNRLIKTRRSHKAALSKLEKDVDNFTARLKSSSDDTKQRQKLLQAERSIRQLDEQTASLSAALDHLAETPEDDMAGHVSKKKDFQDNSDTLAAANETLVAARAAAKEELALVHNELTAVVARKERLVSRQARLAEQHDRITQANAQGLNERERRAADSTAKETEHLRMEKQYHDQFTYLNHEIHSLQMRTNQAWQEVAAYEKQAQSQRELMYKNAPVTPEGHLPGTMAHLATRAVGFGFPPASVPATSRSPEQQSSPFLAYAGPLSQQARPRSDTNRSAGAASNFSAEFDDADPIPPMPTTHDFDPNRVNGRKGSGSSRGRNSDSPGVIGTTGLGSPIRGSHSPGQGHHIW